MTERLPMCLHTCLHCAHAVILEEYSAYTRKLIFDGCWKFNHINLPIDREDCERFAESEERVKRSFWKKWEWKVYVDGNLIHHEQPGRGSDKICKQSSQRHDEPCEPFKRADEIYYEQVTNQDHSEICKQPTECYEPCEPTPSESTSVSTNTIDTNNTSIKEKDLITTRASIPGHEQIDKKNVTCVTRTDVQKKNTTTRSLILQALANNIHQLKDIAHFAEVDRSTAHYHLRNLIKEERVIKVSWGHYAFSDKNFLDHGGRTFEKLLKNFSHLGRCTRGHSGLHPTERNILMDILSKDNKYERFSERELARKNNISRYMVKKYTEKLEKKKLIRIKREKNQFVFVPTEVAINGSTGFFHTGRTGSKSGKESSKIQPVYQPVENSKIQPITEKSNGLQNEESLRNAATETPGTYTPSENVLETFEDYLVWQQKNAHRMIIQFKLLKCNHDRLKGTGWIFDKKRIHRHFTEAYIFKSKDPTGHFVNVLPKYPFIFTSPFEFEEKIVAFVNEAIDRLRDYQMIVDLSEPAEIRLQHEAIEDDPFSRKIIKKGLLYFESKAVTVDQTGELIKYAMKIDKSKSLHFEFEGPEAHHLTEKLEAFVDDVVTGKIDRKKLREIPQKVELLKKELGREVQHIEERLDTSVRDIHNAQKLLAQNQVKLSEDLVSCMEVITKIGEACESMARAAHIIMRDVELLTTGTQAESNKCSYLSNCS